MNVATLPNGEVVEVPKFLDDDWFQDKKTGYIDPSLLAPYSRQPRTFMDPVKLAELEKSVSSQGVRESLVVTPMKLAPWAEVAPGDEHLPFLIVSGHRRRGAAIAGKVTAVPIEVRLYKNEAAFDEDAGTLNDHRQDLSAIEEGWRYRRKIEGGEKITHISERSGHAVQWIQARIHLTYLCPTIQKLISPELKPRERLAGGFASALGGVGLGRGFSHDQSFDFEGKLKELGSKEPYHSDLSEEEQRFLVQRAYLNFCRQRSWRGVVSEKFVRTGEMPNAKQNRTSGAAGKHLAVVDKTKGLRRRMLDWFLELNAMGFLDRSMPELERMFSNAVRNDLETMADRLVLIAETLRAIASKKPKYSSEALLGQERLEEQIFKDD